MYSLVLLSCHYPVYKTRDVLALEDEAVGKEKRENAQETAKASEM